MVNIDWLRYFLAVVETGSFQAAADRVHVTPQAVSKAIASLENFYRVKLLERDQRIRRLTPAGRTLLEMAPAVLVGLDNLETAIREHRSRVPVGPVSIASVTFCHNYLLPPLVARILERYPRIIPQLVAMPPERVEERVASGEADLGILFCPPRRGDLAWSAGRAIASVIVSRPQKRGAWSDFGYVVPYGTADGGTEALDGWPGGGYRRRVVAEVNQLEAALHLCEAGVGAAFVPELAVRERLQSGSLAIVADPPALVENRLFVIQRAGVRPSRAAQAVLEGLQVI